MLAVGSRLTPVNRTGLILNFGAVQRDMFSVTLHRQLLQVSRESLQILLVGKDRNGSRVEKIGVPDSDQSHQNRQISLKRSSAEVLVHLMESVQHGPEILRTNGDHRRKANRRIHRVAPTNPVPESKHVGRVNAELRYL